MLVDKGTPAIVEASMSGDGLAFRKVRYIDRFEMPSHSHEEPHLFLCLAGNVEHNHFSRTGSLAPATLAFVPGEAPHSNRFHGAVETFDIVLSTRWMQRAFGAAPMPDGPVECRGGVPVGLAMRMYREFLRPDTLTALMLEGLTMELLAHLARGHSESKDDRIPRWLARTADYLDAHCTENLSLESIAVVADVHPDHLTRAFRQHFKTTIGDYLRQKRIEYACRLLTGFGTSLAQVARESGFADQSHFHKNFKALMGMTPAKFRDLVGSNADFRKKMLR